MSVNEGRVGDVMKKIGRGVKKELTREKPLFGPESPYPLLRGRKARKAAAEKLKNENSYERIYNMLTESPEPKPADVVKAAIAKKGGIEAVKKERSDARKAARRDMKDVLASKAAERRDDVKRGFRTSANITPDEYEVESDLRHDAGIKSKNIPKSKDIK